MDNLDAQIFLIISAPARLWLWVCAKLCGLGYSGDVEYAGERDEN